MQILFILGCLLVVKADVRLPPEITEHPIAEVIYELNSQNVTITCEADGIPEVEYSWKKNQISFELNQENIRPDPETGSFTFKELYANDAGYYQCFAKNQYGMAMSQISSVQQTLLGSFPTRQDPFDYVVNHGDKLTLKCSAPSSFPVPTYKWALADDMADKHPVLIQESKRIMWDLKGDLHFANVQLDDSQGSRIYMCKVYNPNSKTGKSGSESQITVKEGSPASTGPVLAYGPGLTVIVLAGEVLTIQCIFSGFPTPNVTITRVGNAMPYLKYESDKFGTVMKIKDIQEVDAGKYKCTGENSQGKKEHEFKVDVQVKPQFLDSEDNKPHNVNMTEGEDAVFNCSVKAEPKAVVQWLKNGDPINSADPGPGMRLSEGGMKLTIKDLCKTCGNGQTDLMVIQCNASNKHGYAFAEGYLNVLAKTVLIEKPQNTNITAWEGVIMFPCVAESDDSTQIKITWYLDDTEIDPTNKAYKILPNGLQINIILLENEQKDKVAGKYKCVARNGWSSESAEAYLMFHSDPVRNVTTPAVGVATITESSISWLMIIIISVAGSLLLILLLLVCCLCMHRDKGEEYQVYEKEKKFGLNPEKELTDNGFHEYQRLEVRPFMGSLASLSSRMNLSESGNKGSLIEYTEQIKTL